MFTKQSAEDTIKDDIAGLTAAIVPKAPCTEAHAEALMRKWKNALMHILAASRVDFSKPGPLRALETRISMLQGFSYDEIVVPVLKDPKKCEIPRPWTPSLVYRIVLQDLDPNLDIYGKSFEGITRKALLDYDATVKPWSPDQDQSHKRASSSHRENGASPTQHIVVGHPELALGQHRRIGYRHASLMGVETEGPAGPDGGLLLAASH